MEHNPMRTKDKKEEEMGQHVKDVIKEKEKNEEEAVPSMVIYLPLEDSALSFNLEKAVCNHGFFMMTPNQWIPSIKTLQRPLYLADSTTSVVVQISHPKKNDHLHVLVLGTNFLSPQDQKVLLTQIARMLKISKKDERKMQKFHEIHSKAKKKRFGRLFRSPTLFEDMVKTILLCTGGWARSLDMSKAFC
ncbi:uncharacterized protein LOC122088711 [Macadamia integrifolia]|uniref:uncharacterized protein LOC122088711 n=1 Tax=Macadamia integrifolia TaxID=60698 RepID=UPI001C4F1B28|nr:uncharacterized protein LOC122088711 [Macadamia integrifolia]